MPYLSPFWLAVGLMMVLLAGKDPQIRPTLAFAVATLKVALMHIYLTSEHPNETLALLIGFCELLTYHLAA